MLDSDYRAAISRNSKNYEERSLFFPSRVEDEVLGRWLWGICQTGRVVGMVRRDRQRMTMLTFYDVQSCEAALEYLTSEPDIPLMVRRCSKRQTSSQFQSQQPDLSNADESKSPSPSDGGDKLMAVIVELKSEVTALRVENERLKQLLESGGGQADRLSVLEANMGKILTALKIAPNAVESGRAGKNNNGAQSEPALASNQVASVAKAAAMRFGKNGTLAGGANNMEGHKEE